MDAPTVLGSLQVLAGEEPAVATAFLLGAVYTCCLHSGETPQTLVEQLWKSVPSSEAWPALRDALLAMLEGGEGSGRTSPP